jgi:hypothetical protein
VAMVFFIQEFDRVMGHQFLPRASIVIIKLLAALQVLLSTSPVFIVPSAWWLLSFQIFSGKCTLNRMFPILINAKPALQSRSYSWLGSNLTFCLRLHFGHLKYLSLLVEIPFLIHFCCLKSLLLPVDIPFSPRPGRAEQGSPGQQASPWRRWHLGACGNGWYAFKASRIDCPTFSHEKLGFSKLPEAMKFGPQPQQNM